MQVPQLNRDVQVSPSVNRQQVTIKASADMVRRVILPYTNYALAAVRETVVGNAMDASTRVTLRMPTRFNPMWRSRDYGAGIPQQQMYTFYSMAGHSTKTTVNTQQLADGQTIAVMGCKGVGRFAPLGVTEQFLIRNFCEGREVVGQVYFDHEGHPVFDIISDQPSSEPTGVEISFAVDINKIADFEAAVQQALRYVPDYYQLEWEGDAPEIKRPEAKWKGPGWWLTNADSVAIMGRIGYAIDPHQFGGKNVPLLNAGIEFEVPLGSIDVNDAREQIIYNDRTKQAVNTALDNIRQTVLDSVYDSVANASTLWEATAAYEQTHSKLFSRGYGQSPQMQWKGQTLGHTIMYEAHKIAARVNNNITSTNLTLSAPVAVSEFNIGMVESGWQRRSRLTLKYHGNLDVSPTGCKIVVVDTTVRVNDTILAWAMALPASSIPSYNSYRGYTCDTILVLRKDHPHFDKMLDALGNPPASAITYTSTMPLAPKATRLSNGQPRTVTTFEVFDHKVNNYVKQPVDRAKPAIFVHYYNNVPKNHRPVVKSNTPFGWDAEACHTNERIYRLLLADDPRPLVKVPGTVLDQIKKASSWVELHEALKAKLDELGKIPEFVEAYKTRAYISAKLQYSDWRTQVLLHDEKLRAALAPNKHYDIAYQLHNNTSRNPIVTTKTDTIKLLDDMLASAPLLQYLVAGSAPINEIVDYLKANNVQLP